MPWGLNYFATFDAFSLGAIVVIQTVIFVYAFTYLGVKGNTDKPVEKAGSIALAMLAAIFLTSIFGLPSIVTGFIGVITWSLAMKHYMKMEHRKWIVSFVVLWAMLTLFAVVDDFSRCGLIVFGLGYKFIEGEMQIRDKKKTNEGDKKEVKK